MAPGVLDTILDRLPSTAGIPEVLVGLEPGDDAAVWRLDNDRAIVATVDIITPIVDDPETFGRIAATNSISDIYAMGGRPLLSLSIACFPASLPTDSMGGILAGAAQVALDAGAPILGGHTIKDDEVKFGLAVIGEIHPDRILRNSEAKVGDALVLTKPIGSASLATAFKAGAYDEADPRYLGHVANMTLSNRRASEIAREAGARAATDVTGFGLSGHLLEMAAASNVGIELEYNRIPFLDGAREALAAGFNCGGARANEAFAGQRLSLRCKLDVAEEQLLHDPQTAGPLLFTLGAELAPEAVKQLQYAGYSNAGIIGHVTGNRCGTIEVI